jgi:hypothetical protein
MLFLTAFAAFAGTAMAQEPASSRLDDGFQEMYRLQFENARQEFALYEQDHPSDGFGKAAEASSYLFEELNDQGVLTSAFFLDDNKFLKGIDGSPDPARSNAFLRANNKARDLAQQALKDNPRDTSSLLVLTMTDGMAANYEAILMKHQIASLKFLRRSEDESNRLLAVDPDAYDGYVGVGTANYIIGSLPDYKRALLWFGGIHGDRERGMQQVQQAAVHGHYLQPFAEILLALASEREHQMDRARSLLQELAFKFPENPHFARELALADGGNPQLCCVNQQP